MFAFLSRRNAARRGRTGTFSSVGGHELDEAEVHRDRRALVGPLGLAYCLVLIAVAVAILDYDVLPPALKVRDVAQSDSEARVDFSFFDTAWLERQRNEKAAQAPLVFRNIENWMVDLLRDLRVLAETAQSTGSGEEAVALSADYPFDRPLVEELYKYNKDRNPQTLTTILVPQVELTLKWLLRNGVMSESDFEVAFKKGGERLLIRFDPSEPKNRAPAAPLDRVFTRIKARTELAQGLQALSLPKELDQELKRHLFQRLSPNLKRDESATRQEEQAARAAVIEQPRPVAKGTLILAKHALVKEDTVRLLHEEARAFKASQSAAQHAKRLGGYAILSATVLLFFLLTLRRLQVQLQHARVLVMLGLTALAVLAASKLLMLHEAPRQLAPVAIATVLASLACSQGVALAMAVCLSVLVGFAAGGDMPLTLTLMTGALVAALPARRLQNRWDLLRYGFLGGAAQSCAICGFGLLHHAGLELLTGFVQGGAAAHYPMLRDAPWGLFNGVACGLLLLGSLPAAEMAFGIITNIRLFELCDQNQPGLRKIQMEAPGTWAHTLQVAFMAEPAAEAIGANARLVRTGTYYHDLGKTLKPEYFIENQMGTEDRHRRLAPSVSALIITAHVKDGVELAREYKLPKQIMDFIPEHHGTTLVSYFYHSAKKQAQESEQTGHAGTVQEAFYRYPGPKPQSRETAIVMLADTVEAATRTLESPSAARLRTFIHDLIMNKLLDRQLDESDLTFRDLAAIEDAFLRVLVGRFHTRVRYPGQATGSTPTAVASEPHTVDASPVTAIRPAHSDTKLLRRPKAALATPEQAGGSRDPHGPLA